MRGKITKESVETLKPGDLLSDTNPTGFVARCQKSSKVSYFYRYRDKTTGKKFWLGLGVHGDITPKRARELALLKAGEVAGGSNPLLEQAEARAEAVKADQADKNTVNYVLDQFEAKHVTALRSADQVKRSLQLHVRPAIGNLSIYEVKRRSISDMLDKIEDDAGPVAADRALAHVRKAFNWWAIRDDDFSSPIVRGMARTKPKQRARKRVLVDDEIRDIWTALDTAKVPACYPRYVRSLLLTMTRRNEASEMHSTEVDGDIWTIPGERYKTKLDHVIPLTPAALDLIGAKPERVKGNAWFVFTTDDNAATAFSGFSKAKAALNAEIAKIRKAAGRKKMERWTLHDLRRTGRSLMSRAGVDTDHAERCLGHVIGGVRETYDRYEYLDEKRKAFERLAGLISSILKANAMEGSR